MTRTELKDLHENIFKSVPLHSSGYHFSQVYGYIKKYKLSDSQIIEILEDIKGTFDFIMLKLEKYDVNLAFIFWIYCETILDGKDKYLKSDEFKNAINQFRNGNVHVQDANMLVQLENLIGLNNVKKEFKSLVALSKAQSERKRSGMPSSVSSLHLVFTGNPGTGKTTVARMIGEIYKSLNLLEKGHLVEVSRHDLIAKYVGHTAIKVSEKIEEALGGILFIDEAYSLTSYEKSNDFGSEAIQTLLKLMEDYRNDFAVIVAGYPNEMSLFLNSNPGLKSRFSTTIEFEDYIGSELFEILQHFASIDEMKFSDEAIHKVSYLFTEKFGHNGTASNARFVRNYYESIIKHQAERLYEKNDWSKQSLSTIELDDIIDI